MHMQLYIYSMHVGFVIIQSMYKFYFYFLKPYYYYFWPPHVACGVLVPPPGIVLAPPAVEARSLNHWTNREVLMYNFYRIKSQLLFLALQILSIILFNKSKISRFKKLGRSRNQEVHLGIINFGVHQVKFYLLVEYVAITKVLCLD